ncbi:MAG: hypothetical protein AB1589_37300 [Cyanobacteriota bacterium]
MSNSNELPLGQQRLLANLEQTQERIHEVVNSCIERLASEGVEDLDALKETLLQEPQNFDETQRHLLGSLLNDLIALKYQQQDLIRQIDEYVARSGLPGLPNPQPLPKYGCPRCNHTKYQLSPQQYIGDCPVHQIPLVRKP